MADVKKGMVVQLKSGGPELTVEYIDSDGLIHCRWFNDKELKDGVFTLEILKIIKNEPKVD